MVVCVIYRSISNFHGEGKVEQVIAIVTKPKQLSLVYILNAIKNILQINFKTFKLISY